MVDLKAKMEEECKGHGIEGIENRVATIERGRKHIRLQYSVPPSLPLSQPLVQLGRRNNRITTPYSVDTEVLDVSH